MPGRNGTGPRGQGALTGQGLGSCIVKLPDGLEILEEKKKRR